MPVRKYVLISDSLSSGGAQRAASIFASGIAERGYEVHLVLYERVEQEYPISPRVRLHLLPKRNGESRIRYYAHKLLSIRRLIIDLNPDIIIPFLPDQANHFFLASRFTNIPFISTVRNNPYLYPESKQMRMLGKLVALLSTGIFLQTEEQAGFFPAYARGKTFVVPNPVSNELFHRDYQYREELKEISSFGRLSPQKNQRLLIQAFASVHKTYPSIRLNLYGAGEEEPRLRDLASELGIPEAVCFRGRVSNVADALLASDLFVLSSDYEGMPNALMEAMAVGLPCISTNCPTGPKDLIEHRKDGLLVECNDVNQLAAAITYCIENPRFCQRMGKEARRKMREEYKVDVVVDKLIYEINELAKGSHDERKRA